MESAKSQYVAFDLGAESGRAICGILEGGKVTLNEVHRFPTGMMEVHGQYKWNIFRMYEEILYSLHKCISQLKIEPESIAVDTWGVDFSLLGAEGNILDLPFCYRDPRTNGLPEEFFTIMPKERLYALTGIQIMQINSIFQLIAIKKNNPLLLKAATDLLFMPDLFNYLLSGIRSTEFSFATTSQLYNPMADSWEAEIFSAIGVNIDIMQKVVNPGTIIGKLHNGLSKQLSIKEMQVVSVASHDTGSAIAAIPADGDDWAYISSGTWSLMGLESKFPLISNKTREFNITNEGGVDKTFRVLKNIMGLWLLQQCRSIWGREKYNYAQLVEMASNAQPFAAFFNPDDIELLNPPDMPLAIQEACRLYQQEIPEGIGAITRVILESLALKYRYTLDQLREISPKPINIIYIIGGGVQNELLCQFTANACGVKVITGPSEGAALGNILVQAMALGKISSLAEIRNIVKASFPSKTYEPANKARWDEAYMKFKEHLGREF